MISIEELAKAGFRAYCDSVDNKNYAGKEIPAWENLGENIQGAWKQAALAIEHLVVHEKN